MINYVVILYSDLAKILFELTSPLLEALYFTYMQHMQRSIAIYPLHNQSMLPMGINLIYW